MIYLIRCEMYRLTKGKKIKKYIAVILLTVLCSFGGLLLFEKEFKSFSDSLLNSFKSGSYGGASYNFGLFKVWDLHSSVTASVGNMVQSVVTSGNIALLIGLYCADYTYVFRKKTALFLESQGISAYRKMGMLIGTEVLLANVFFMIYELFLGIISLLYGKSQGLAVDVSGAFCLWIVCMHFNITAFALLSSMFMMISESKHTGFLFVISITLAGSMCIRIIRMFFHLSESWDHIYVLNNMMDSSFYKMNWKIFGTNVMVAAVTMIVSAAVILLELKINDKERYR